MSDILFGGLEGVQVPCSHCGETAPSAVMIRRLTPPAPPVVNFCAGCVFRALVGGMLAEHHARTDRHRGDLICYHERTPTGVCLLCGDRAGSGS